MGKPSSPSPPAAPDPYAVASAQTQGNVQSAIANAWLGNANTNGPTGSTTYNQNGTHTITDAQGNPIQVPSFSVTQSLSPSQQGLYDQQTQLGSNLNQLALDQTGKLSGLLGSPINTGAIPGLTTALNFQSPAATPNLQSTFNQGSPVQTGYASGGPIQSSVPFQSSVNQSMSPTSFGQGPGQIQTSLGPTDFSADRQSVVDALNSRTQPALDRQREQLQSQLANQGIDIGSQAWNNATDAFGRQVNDANQQNILAGGQEQSRLFGLDLAQGQFGNAAQQQGYDQALGRGQFAQNATNANNAAALNAGQFANQSALNAGNFANAAQGQQYSQIAAGAAFNNAAAGQQYAQNQGATQFANATNQQNYSNQQNAIDVSNQLAQQGATFGNQASAQQLQQILALRNQPINEITALMNGGQVSMPQFAGYNAPQIAGSSIGQNIYNTSAIQQQQYQSQVQQQQAQQSAALSGLFGLGSSALLGGLGGMGGFSGLLKKATTG